MHQAREAPVSCGDPPAPSTDEDSHRAHRKSPVCYHRAATAGGSRLGRDRLMRGTMLRIPSTAAVLATLRW